MQGLAEIAAVFVGIINHHQNHAYSYLTFGITVGRTGIWHKSVVNCCPIQLRERISKASFTSRPLNTLKASNLWLMGRTWGRWGGMEDVSLVRAGAVTCLLFLVRRWGSACTLQKSQFTQPSETMSLERLLPAPPKFEGYSYLFWGGTMRLAGDGVVLLGGKSEETAGCGFPWPYPRLVLTLTGFTPGDGEEPGGHIRTSPSWWDLLPWSHQTHQLQRTGVTLQKGNNLKLGKRENSFQKAWKLARFMLRITPLPQYPEWIMPNFPCTHAHTQNPPLGNLTTVRKFRSSSSWKEGIWNKSVLWSKTTKCVSSSFDI